MYSATGVHMPCRRSMGTSLLYAVMDLGLTGPCRVLSIAFYIAFCGMKVGLREDGARPSLPRNCERNEICLMPLRPGSFGKAQRVGYSRKPGDLPDFFLMEPFAGKASVGCLGVFLLAVD
jgi:hypothetical protein